MRFFRMKITSQALGLAELVSRVVLGKSVIHAKTGHGEGLVICVPTSCWSCAGSTWIDAPGPNANNYGHGRLFSLARRAGPATLFLHFILRTICVVVAMTSTSLNSQTRPGKLSSGKSITRGM